MTNEEILKYFATDLVYKFTGTVEELKELQQTTNNSYNYLIVADVIYVRAEKPIVSSKAAILTGE